MRVNPWKCSCALPPPDSCRIRFENHLFLLIWERERERERERKTSTKTWIEKVGCYREPSADLMSVLIVLVGNVSLNIWYRKERWWEIMSVDNRFSGSGLSQLAAVRTWISGWIRIGMGKAADHLKQMFSTLIIIPEKVMNCFSSCCVSVIIYKSTDSVSY